MIRYINRELLEPHPDNPRKDLGDLNELMASISRQGLLQNLTVVPSPEHEGKYRIVIGHRRFAAAKLAGMQELPCAIDEHMTYTEQLAVMMSENIQRSDLTVTEKVGGVQLMMDLGIKADQIAEKTGISSSTVYKYAKLARLKSPEMAKAEQRGATLIQMAEINDFEDAESRRRLLNAAGTTDWSAELLRARRERNKARWLPGIVRELRKYGAVEIDEEDWQKHEWLKYLNWSGDHSEDIARLCKNRDVAYVIRDYDVALYEVRNVDPDADRKAEAKRLRREMIDARQRDEAAMARRFREKRDEFVRSFDPAGERKTGEVLRFTLWLLTRSQYLYSLMIGGIFATEIMSPQDEEPNYTGSIKVSAEDIDSVSDRTLWRATMIAAYERISSDSMRCMDKHTGEYKKHEALDDLYDYLQAMGYVMTDEEMDWLTGTHKIYKEAVADEQ